MTSVIKMCTAIVMGAMLSITSVQAANVETPLPDNTYISKNGLDWVWAYPYNNGHANFDLAYQSQFGWRIPTAQELAQAPSATDFIFVGANVPLGGTDPLSGASFQVANAALDGAAACATPYFSNGTWNHCDWGDGNNDLWWGLPDVPSYSEQLLVRGALQEDSVPSMTTLGLVLMGLILFGIAATRFRKV